MSRFIDFLSRETRLLLLLHVSGLCYRLPGSVYCLQQKRMCKEFLTVCSGEGRVTVRRDLVVKQRVFLFAAEGCERLSSGLTVKQRVCFCSGRGRKTFRRDFVIKYHVSLCSGKGQDNSTQGNSSRTNRVSSGR